MGSGKGYLTFALASLLGSRATVHGVEARSELTELCQRVARDNHLSQLTFTAGTIDSFAADSGQDSASEAIARRCLRRNISNVFSREKTPPIT